MQRCSGPGLAEVLAADGLIARAAVRAAEAAAFVAQEFDLRLLLRREGAQLLQRRIQAEIRHDIPKLRPRQLLTERREVRQDLCRGRDEIQPRIMLPQVIHQQVGMDNDSVFSARFEQAAQRIAARVGQVLRPQQGIAERQAGGDTVVPQQGQRVARAAVAAADASAAPEAALRRAVDRANAAPVIKILPVLKNSGRNRR